MIPKKAKKNLPSDKLEHVKINYEKQQVRLNRYTGQQ